MVLGPGGDVTALGTPGGDVQLQAMLQVLLNMVAFGMSPAARRRGAPLRDPVVPGLVLAPPLLPGPRHPRGPPPGGHRRGAARPRSRGRALDGLGMARRRRVRGARRRRRDPLGRGGPAPRLLRGGVVRHPAPPDWRRRTLRAPAARPLRCLTRGGRILLLLLSVTGCAVEPPRPALLPPPPETPGLVALVPPPILSRFGEWRGEGGAATPTRHAGIDIRATTGTPVLAAADGVVLRTGSQVFAGRLIVVEHDVDRHDGVLPPLGGGGRGRPGRAARRGHRAGGRDRERDGAAPALRRLPARREGSAASGSTEAGRIRPGTGSRPTRASCLGRPTRPQARRLTYPVPCQPAPEASRPVERAPGAGAARSGRPGRAEADRPAARGAGRRRAPVSLDRGRRPS